MELVYVLGQVILFCPSGQVDLKTSVKPRIHPSQETNPKEKESK